jgi:TRAP-type C4-dicarboxylate transport system substrate-binding protein
MKKFDFYIVTIALLVPLFLALAAMPKSVAAKTDWKFTNIQPAGMIYTKYFNLLADMLTEATNGEVKVTNYPAGELPYKATGLLKVCSKGLVDLVEVCPCFVSGEAPLLALLDFPFLSLNNNEMETLRRVVTPYIYKDLRNRGVEVLTLVYYGPRQIVSSNPIHSLHDLKGQKVRTAGSLEGSLIKLWSAVPTSTVWSELYTAAQRGVIDAVMTATPAIQVSKVYEVCPYFFKIDGALVHMFMCVNKKSWNKLSKNHRDSMSHAASKWAKIWKKEAIDALEATALNEMKSKGQIKSVYELPREKRIETREKIIPHLREYVNKHMQPDGPKIFEEALEALNIK